MPTHAPVSYATITYSSPAQQSHQITMLSGAGESIPQASMVPAFCAPFDVNCWLGQAAHWIAQNIFTALRPLTPPLNHSSPPPPPPTPPPGPSHHPPVIHLPTL